eukprot:m.373885 g.373885  ORF g.373885 m.373885 type:complete len:233 (+) comp56155_c2_seq1:707-1405(+)
MSAAETIAIALGVILGVFVLTTACIVLWFWYKYRHLYTRSRRRRRRPRMPFSTEPSSSNSKTSEAEEDDQIRSLQLTTVMSGDDQTDVDMLPLDDASIATKLIPHGLSFLKTCKRVSQQVVVVAMDDSDRFLGNVKSILEAAMEMSPWVDRLAQCLHPPISSETVRAHSIDLFNALANFVDVAKENFAFSEHQWIVPLMEQATKDFRVLKESIRLYDQSLAVARLQHATSAF